MRSIVALAVFALGLYLGALIGYRTAARDYQSDDQTQGTQLEIANGRE